MNKFLKIARDPIWQAVGVLVGVLTLFLAVSTPSPLNGELAIIKTQTVNFADFLLPSRLLRLNSQKSTQSMEGALVDYYAVVNRGSKPIVPANYISPLTIKSKSDEEIVLVDSCAQPNGTPTSNSTNSCKPGSFVTSTWQQQEESWVQERALLNPGEQFCVIVIRKSNDGPSSSSAIWSGRIVGVKIATYESIDEYSKSLEKGLADYLQTSVQLVGFGAYWFVILQVAAFYATLLLARQANWLHTQMSTPIWPVALVMMLSTSTSEILVDIFVNQNTTRLSPLVWPLLSIHFLLILYLITRAIRIKHRDN